MSGRLRRTVTQRGLFSLAFGSIVGVGWVTVLGHWLEAAGPLGSVVAFLLGGALMMAVALCYAELISAMPVAGGEIAYSYRAFGTGKSFWVGWLLAFGYIAVSAFEAAAVGRVLAYLWPGLPGPRLYTFFGSDVHLGQLVSGLLFTGVIFWVNRRGMGFSAKLQIGVTSIIIAAGVVFAAAGLFAGRLENLQPLFASANLSGMFGGVLAVFVTVPLWFVGFDVIPQVAEEARADIPPTRLGRLILMSVAWATLFYVAMILAASAVTPWQGLLGASLPTATAFEQAFTTRFMADLVLWAALAGLFTSWNGFFVAGTRVLFALGRARLVSARLAAIHERHATPHHAVSVVGAATALSCFLGEKAMLNFVNISSLCLALAFLGVSLSMARLRLTAPDLARPYRAPGRFAVPLIAAAGSLLICGALMAPFSPARLRWPVEWLLFGGWCLLGGILWRLAAPARNAVSEQERARLILQLEDS